jgi:hypothetical protein
MISFESILSIAKDDLPGAAKALDKEDIQKLIEWLSLKDDSIRYQAFLLLQHRSLLFSDVYPYWDTLKSKLKSENSYQRSIALMLIAENARWDAERRMENTLDEFLERLNDEKPITVRQCIQSLGEIAAAKPGLAEVIASRLICFDIMAVKETMRKSILLDILNVLLAIRKVHSTGEIENFIRNALSGELLDKKAKKQIEGLI